MTDGRAPASVPPGHRALEELGTELGRAEPSRAELCGPRRLSTVGPTQSDRRGPARPGAAVYYACMTRWPPLHLAQSNWGVEVGRVEREHRPIRKDLAKCGVMRKKSQGSLVTG